MDHANEQAYLAECVTLIPEQIQEEFTRLSADMAYWGQRYADAYRLALDTEMERKRVYGQRFFDLAVELEVSSKKGKAPTADERKHAVEFDVAYLAARSRENRAEAEKIRLYGVLDAIKAKRDMLISLAAQQRAEREVSKYGERE
jgi:hypothetical protein